MKTNKNNLILMTDSYKLTHFKQYPKGTTKVYSYLESRGGVHDKTLFFGLQYYLKKYLEGNVVSMEDIDEAEMFSKLHFGNDLFNREGWEYIVKRYGGKLPIKIMAVKEGSLVKNSNVLMTIENTDPNCFWLTNVLETLLMKIWYPITVATNSFYAKKIIAEALENSAENLDSLPFKLHDFGYRGVSTEEQARVGGMAHLVNFMGTDTVYSIMSANEFYNKEEFKMYAYSVPASEHSVACSYGKESEEKYFLTMIENYPTGILSIVSDTYNVFNFVETMSDKFRNKILSRNGTVVFRPDSGDPVEVNTKLIDILWKKFGGTYVKGYKLLDPHVRLIQGDGIDINTLKEILNQMMANGYSADNWVFGSGGGLLQKFDRDTQKFALKASYIEINGKGKAISKDPVTSKGKRSKAGILKLHDSGREFTTINSVDESESMFKSYHNALELVYENGEIKREQSFDEIREKSNQYLELELGIKQYVS
jgi:nicotinamide phosphoribosyltransferase